MMTIISYADSTRVLPPDNPFRTNDFNIWLGGRRPGEIADSALNPAI